MKNLRQNFKALGWGLISATLVLQPTLAQAQIQRSFLNPGFEEPIFGSGGQKCYVQVSPGIIPGWETTHGPVKPGTGNCTPYTSPGTAPLIEIWTTGFSSVNTSSTPTSAGNQFAELNAEQNSKLYQRLCLIQGESIQYLLLHRGRNSPTTRDVAQFLIGTTIFGTFSTTSNGATTTPVAGTGASAISQSSAGNGWVRYSGTVNYSGTTGTQDVGFAAVSAAGGATQGNFLDEVQFAGLPVIEFTASSGGSFESETTPITNPPQIRIVGLVPSGGITVPISVTGGTATLGTDYTTSTGTPNFSITIPAGNYDGSTSSIFKIPVTIVNDGTSEGGETIEFTIQPASSFIQSSTITCGATATVKSTYTISDDDYVSGTVWNDVDSSANNTFTNINTGTETGTNAGGLNAILVNGSGNVIATTPVNADGTYRLNNIANNQSNVKIILSTTTGSVGAAAPTPSLPASWTNTSPLTTATFTTGTTNNITGKDFGIKQLFVNISGTVFSDADADVTINGSDAGTNAGSANLTIYAVDTAGKVLDKATVAANGTYSFTKVPANTSVTLRLSNDSTVAIGATAPTASSIPGGWYYTGENKNGTVDGTIATLGNIALTTTTSNLTNQNFGIRQAYTITADPAPTICNPDYRTALNTGITAAGGQLATGANDLNWTAEWIAGPASGPGTPYAPPRPVGTMPAVVVGNLAPGAWINEPANVRWISYPFRLSVNSNGYHDNADLDGINGEGNSGFSGPGTSDDVRLKFTSQLTLPSNANTISISLPVGVAIDNQFVSIKVNGVENLVPTPTANPIAADYGTTKNVNITNGWQAGVNTIEVVVDSGPDRVGFFLAVQATTTQVCTNPNVLLVKRITAINGDRTKNPNDNTPLNAFVDDTTSTRQADDNSPNWKSNYLLGAIDAGLVLPGDEIEYTIYFLNAGSSNANTVRVCDRLSASLDFKGSAYGTSKDVQLQLGTSTVLDLTSASDAGDRTQLISAGSSVPANCYLKAANNNGTLVIDVTGNTGVPNLTTMPGSTGQASPNDSYGNIRFVTKVKP
ncbi:hypothetical protein LC653_34405 [Nostoc sp. CHAB 5784]|uniref:beta strand repeat-containing protein n=1 Tax=Nostoc mirabile TaxID=2907820 RepID=UPI001E2B22EA|nr:hypothetical protein [Nostoc mirabile]MCC5668811.1 hypothetical protein [Nostoc mirabile CHAB5784]